MNLAEPATPRRALVAQLAALIVAALFVAGLVATTRFPSLLEQPLLLALIQGVFAALISHLLRGPAWWLPLQLSFVPLAVSAQRLNLPPWLWLSGFIFLLLVFWRTDRSRVPLYLSNTLTIETLAALLPKQACTVIDLGCGDGRLIKSLAKQRPDSRFVGFEHAPLTWAWARLTCRGQSNLTIRFGDFWTHPLSNYDIVYAFLSPSPMAQLWSKAQKEMKAGTQLISNSFPVPDQESERLIRVADGRKTLLFCYRPAG